MQRERGCDRSIQRVDPTAGREPTDRAARAAYGAAHAFVLIAHDQDRRSREIELTHALRSVGVQTDDGNAALARRSQGAYERGHPAQPSVLDCASRRATGRGGERC